MAALRSLIWPNSCKHSHCCQRFFFNPTLLIVAEQFAVVCSAVTRVCSLDDGGNRWCVVWYHCVHHWQSVCACDPCLRSTEDPVIALPLLAHLNHSRLQSHHLGMCEDYNIMVPINQLNKVSLGVQCLCPPVMHGQDRQCWAGTMDSSWCHTSIQ